MPTARTTLDMSKVDDSERVNRVEAFVTETNRWPGTQLGTAYVEDPVRAGGRHHH